MIYLKEVVELFGVFEMMICCDFVDNLYGFSLIGGYVMCYFVV